MSISEFQCITHGGAKRAWISPEILSPQALRPLAWPYQASGHWLSPNPPISGKHRGPSLTHQRIREDARQNSKMAKQGPFLLQVLLPYLGCSCLGLGPFKPKRLLKNSGQYATRRDWDSKLCYFLFEWLWINHLISQLHLKNEDKTHLIGWIYKVLPILHCGSRLDVALRKICQCLNAQNLWVWPY
jgi:hypothetical protein